MAPPAKDSDVKDDGAKPSLRRPYYIILPVLPPPSYSAATQSTTIQPSISAPLQEKLSRMDSVETHSDTTFGHTRRLPPSSSKARWDGQPESIYLSLMQLTTLLDELQRTILELQSSVRQIEDKLDAHMKKREEQMKELQEEMQAGFAQLAALITERMTPTTAAGSDPIVAHLTVPTHTPASIPYNLITTSTPNYIAASMSNPMTASSSNHDSQYSAPPLKTKKGGLFHKFTGAYHAISARISSGLHSRRPGKRGKAKKDIPPVPPLPAQEVVAPTTAQLDLGQPTLPGRR